MTSPPDRLDAVDRRDRAGTAAQVEQGHSRSEVRQQERGVRLRGPFGVYRPMPTHPFVASGMQTHAESFG
jgi:hypothetical protein